MQTDQISLFRLILRNLNDVLIDLEYNFKLNMLPTKIIFSLVASIDENQKNIISAFDEKNKNEIIRIFFSSDFFKFFNFKETYNYIVDDRLKQLKEEFFDFLRRESMKKNIYFNKGEIENQFTNFLGLNDSLKKISQTPINIEELVMSFNRFVPFDVITVKSILDKYNIYYSYLQFLKHYSFLANFKTSFENGADLSDMFIDYHNKNQEGANNDELSNDTVNHLSITKRKNPFKPVHNDLSFDNNKEYKNVMEKLEITKKKKFDWFEIIIARLEQKSLVLKMENQELQRNYNIIVKQKEEMIELYEDYILELSHQNELLKCENSKLQKKIFTQKIKKDSII